MKLLLDGAPAVTGDYEFNNNGIYRTLSFDNGLIRWDFGPVQNLLYGYTTISATDVIVNGVKLANAVNGSATDGERLESMYVDWAAGKGTNALICDTVKIVRIEDGLAEVAFVDSTNPSIRTEHHLIMTADTAGLFGYVVMETVVAQGLSEVRTISRWDRCLFRHAYNFERGWDQEQPTYAYLFTQDKLGDETWMVDGKPNPDLPCPEDNNGLLAKGDVYSKYLWVLYHSENPFFGHWGQHAETGALFGAWFTPLSGVTGETAAADYGVGPTHQDLAIHQDAIILNYFVANHMGVPSYDVPAGYRRMKGPWLTYVTTQPAGSTPEQLLAEAQRVAEANIAVARSGYLPFIDNQPLYPTKTRTNVTGAIRVTDGRPSEDLWALLTAVVTEDIYGVKEPTYFVRTRAGGVFELPAIPPGTYSLYVFSARGSITEQLRVDGVKLAGDKPVVDLGTIDWSPPDGGYTHLWQIGTADRFGTEFNFGTHVRSYDLPSQVPGDLTFAVGKSVEGKDWYYAQTAPGTWTVSFDLPRAYAGTAHLTIAASLTQGQSPQVSVNGKRDGISGYVPSGSDSTLSRQAVRSGHAQVGALTFAASMLVVGPNTVTFSRDGQAGASGIGYDTVVLAVDEGPPPTKQHGRAFLTGTLTVTPANGRNGTFLATLSAHNAGSEHAMDVRVSSLQWMCASGSTPALLTDGRDAARCPWPLGGHVAPNGMLTLPPIALLAAGPGERQGTRGAAGCHLEARVIADGGRTMARLTSELL